MRITLRDHLPENKWGLELAKIPITGPLKLTFVYVAPICENSVYFGFASLPSLYAKISLILGP